MWLWLCGLQRCLVLALRVLCACGWHACFVIRVSFRVIALSLSLCLPVCVCVCVCVRALFARCISCSVGGAIVASPSKAFVDEFSKLYPGRASMSPVLDVFITLLSLGRQGLKALRQRRKNEIYPYLHAQLEKLAAKHGERVLDTKHNTISIAMTLDRLDDDDDEQDNDCLLYTSPSPRDRG